MGGITSTPVINRPEVAIIAVNKVDEKIVPIDGADIEADDTIVMDVALALDGRGRIRAADLRHLRCVLSVVAVHADTWLQ